MRPTTRLRELLKKPGIIVAPGVYDCLTAKMVEREGFSAVYMTGAGTSMVRTGNPDLGLATMTEMVANASSIASAVDIPVIADADTGYGGVLNVRRTVREYEKAGVAAIHIEDQESPKRCGHLDDKRVIPVDDMALKLRAAVDARTDDDFVIIVRTDALAVTGLDDTLSRCEAYLKAGADVLFVEALQSRDQMERFTRTFDAPLLFNFVEKGKSPLVPAPELERMGFKIVIYPGSAIIAAYRAVTAVLREIREQGTTEALMDDMPGIVEVMDALGLSELQALDSTFAGMLHPVR